VNDDDRPRARRDDDDDDDDRAKRRRQRDDYDDEDFDDRRSRRRRRDEGDVTGGVIPYKNPMALASYYCGVFGLISCCLFLGIFGIVPIILGFLGLRYAKQHPEASGQAHAIIGIVLGLFEMLTFIASVSFVIVSIISKK
jgi:hypothetical protein